MLMSERFEQCHCLVECGEMKGSRSWASRLIGVAGHTVGYPQLSSISSFPAVLRLVEVSDTYGIDLVGLPVGLDRRHRP
jgi:hypothetical protein